MSISSLNSYIYGHSLITDRSSDPPENFLVLEPLRVDEVPSVEHAERVGEEGDGLRHAEDGAPRRRLPVEIDR